MSSSATMTIDLPAPDIPVTSSRRCGRRASFIRTWDQSKLQAHPVESQSHFGGRRCRHGVNADQRQLDPKERPLTALVWQTLDLAGQLDQQCDWNVGHRFHVDDADPADLEL